VISDTMEPFSSYAQIHNEHDALLSHISEHAIPRARGTRINPQFSAYSAIYSFLISPTRTLMSCSRHAVTSSLSRSVVEQMMRTGEYPAREGTALTAITRRGATTMSIRVSTWVWQHSDQTGSARLLLLAIADHAHDNGSGAYPSMQTLAQQIRMSVRNTQYLIRRLVADGALSVALSAGPHGTNVYTVVMDTPSPTRPPATPFRPTSGEEGVPGLHPATGTTGANPGAMGCNGPSGEGATTVAAQPSVTVPRDPPVSEGARATVSRASAGLAHDRRAHDPVWLAAVAAIGEAPITDTEIAAWHAALRQLDSLGSNREAIAAELTTRARRYRARWPTVAMTVPALIRHWTTLATELPTTSQERHDAPARRRSARDLPQRRSLRFD